MMTSWECLAAPSTLPERPGSLGSKFQCDKGHIGEPTSSYCDQAELVAAGAGVLHRLVFLAFATRQPDCQRVFQPTSRIWIEKALLTG
jgi:hypothetical protein